MPGGGKYSFLSCLVLWGASEQIRLFYSRRNDQGVPWWGILAEDPGLHVQDLLTRNLRVSSEKSYFTVNTENGGTYLWSDRIDRESLCPQNPLCVVPLEIVAENPF